MNDIIFYGLDAAGETAHTESLPAADAADLKALARARLGEFHAVEIWQGPLCVVRLRRKPEDA